MQGAEHCECSVNCDYGYFFRFFPSWGVLGTATLYKSPNSLLVSAQNNFPRLVHCSRDLHE